jgi:hypothetical protein
VPTAQEAPVVPVGEEPDVVGLPDGTTEVVPAVPGAKAPVLYSTYVSVVSDNGTALPGITIIAVDGSDKRIETGYKDAVTEAATTNGSASLRLPSGQRYYVKADDLRGDYRPVKSAMLLQGEQQEVKLIMQRGFATTITVSGSGPVVGALVRVLGDPVMEAATRAGGKVTLVLRKGNIHNVQVLHEDYAPLETVVTGGTDTSLTLSPLDANNTGTVRATALN